MLMTLLRAGPGPMIEKALEIDIKIEADAWVDELPQLVRLVDLSAAAAVAACDLECGNTELSILMTDDAEMAELNREWRGGNGATNVLSFPGDLGGPGSFLLGDVVLAFETIVAEATEADISLADHLTHLVVHGVLHLLGYDHKTDAEADKMEALEREILQSLGIPDPYIANRTESYEAAS